MSRTAVPAAPLLLGLAGLIPFWGLTFALWRPGVFGLSPGALDDALASYGALILSFLGGIRWGLVVHGSAFAKHYAISVVPSLVAWGLLALPEPWRLVLLGVAILVLGPIDLGLVRDGLAPRWFGLLRMILSTGAGLALLLGGYVAR